MSEFGVKRDTYGTAEVVTYVNAESLCIVSMCPNKVFVTNLTMGKSARDQYNKHFQTVNTFMNDQVERQQLFREID
jgi:hypothetical protein